MICACCQTPIVGVPRVKKAQVLCSERCICIYLEWEAKEPPKPSLRRFYLTYRLDIV
jgi:hypothetical protein